MIISMVRTNAEQSVYGVRLDISHLPKTPIDALSVKYLSPKEWHEKSNNSSGSWRTMTVTRDAEVVAIKIKDGMLVSSADHHGYKFPHSSQEHELVDELLSRLRLVPGESTFYALSLLEGDELTLLDMPQLGDINLTSLNLGERIKLMTELLPIKTCYRVYPINLGTMNPGWTDEDFAEEAFSDGDELLSFSLEHSAPDATFYCIDPDIAINCRVLSKKAKDKGLFEYNLGLVDESGDEVYFHSISGYQDYTEDDLVIIVAHIPLHLNSGDNIEIKLQPHLCDELSKKDEADSLVLDY